MEPLILALGWVGLYAPLALGAVGSMVGCARAGSAACGALLEVESGYGRYIGVAAMPSSQTIYGIVVTMALRRELTLDNSPGIFGLGVLAGLAGTLRPFSASCDRKFNWLHACRQRCVWRFIGSRKRLWAFYWRSGIAVLNYHLRYRRDHVAESSIDPRKFSRNF